MNRPRSFDVSRHEAPYCRLAIQLHEHLPDAVAKIAHHHACHGPLAVEHFAYRNEPTPLLAMSLYARSSQRVDAATRLAWLRGLAPSAPNRLDLPPKPPIIRVFPNRSRTDQFQHRHHVGGDSSIYRPKVRRVPAAIFPGICTKPGGSRRPAGSDQCRAGQSSAAAQSRCAALRS